MGILKGPLWVEEHTCGVSGQKQLTQAMRYLNDLGSLKNHMPTFSRVMKDREEFVRIIKSTLGLNEDIISGRI